MRTVQTICEIPAIRQGIKFVIERNDQIEEMPKAIAPPRAKQFHQNLILTKMTLYTF